ncbi:hypothetical protein [Pasteuria penetrans]|uniref:hypothetical protein n=1 Tax=Pasteuria penetrans TaxID=86005 RepID=UPI000FA2DC89|nr:hypothetical protein [Pasteuria penetrans]
MSTHIHDTTLSGKINIQKEESWIDRSSMRIGNLSIDLPYYGKTQKSPCPFCHSHNVLIDQKLILTDKTIMAMVDRNLASANRTTAIANENMALANRTTAVANENMALANKTMAMADEKMALANKTIAMADEKMALANKTMAMADEKMALANKTMATANEKMALANKTTAMEAGNKNTKWVAVADEVGKFRSTNPSPASQETEPNPLIDGSPSVTLHDRKDKGPRNARSERDGYHQLHDPKVRDRFLRAQRFLDGLKEGITLWGPKEWEESRRLIGKLLSLCCPSNHKEKTKDFLPLDDITSLMFHHDGGSILVRALIGLLKNAWIPEIDSLTDPKNWKPIVEDLCNLRMRVDRTLHCLKYPQDEGNGVYHRGI